MQSKAQTTAEDLLEQFAADNEHWAESIEKYGLDSPMREVLAEVSSILGEQTPTLCVGSLAFDVTPPPAGPQERSEYPDTYDVVIVTERLIAVAYGYIRGPEKRLEREPTQFIALKNLSGILVSLRPGEPHGDGVPSKHHEVTLTLVDGSTFPLPNSEWLSNAGAERMERLLPGLYAALV